MSRPLDCRIRNRALTIQVSRKILAFAANNHPDFWNGDDDKQTIKVTNIAGFAKDVASALNDEAEDGSTPITRMLDAAILHAIDQGSEHVEEVTPNETGTEPSGMEIAQREADEAAGDADPRDRVWGAGREGDIL